MIRKLAAGIAVGGIMLACLFAEAQAPGTPIDNLNPAATLTGAERVPIQQGPFRQGATVRTTIQSIAAYASANLSISPPLNINAGILGVLYDSNFGVNGSNQLALASCNSGSILGNGTASPAEPVCSTMPAVMARAFGTTSAQFLQYSGGWTNVSITGDVSIAAGGLSTVSAIGGVSATLGGTFSTGGALAIGNMTTANDLVYVSSSGNIQQLTTGTGVATALGVNPGTAGSVLINGGALGTPSGGSAANLTNLPLSGLANQAGNNVLGTLGGSNFPVVALAMTGCSSSGNALQWLTGTGFQCNTSLQPTVASTPYTATVTCSSGAPGTNSRQHSFYRTISGRTFITIDVQNAAGTCVAPMFISLPVTTLASQNQVMNGVDATTSVGLSCIMGGAVTLCQVATASGGNPTVTDNLLISGEIN